MNWWIIADVLLYLAIIEIIYVIILQKDEIGNVKAFKDKKWDAIGCAALVFGFSLIVTVFRGLKDHCTEELKDCFKPEYNFTHDIFFVTLALITTFLIIVFFIKYYFELNVALGKKINKKHIERFEKEEEKFHKKREEEKLKNGTKD